MAIPAGPPCPRPWPGRPLLDPGSFRAGEGRNGEGGASSDRPPSWGGGRRDVEPNCMLWLSLAVCAPEHQLRGFVECVGCVCYLVKESTAIGGVFGVGGGPAAQCLAHAVGVVRHGHGPLVQLRLLL
jgi:hypothetical protein